MPKRIKPALIRAVVLDNKGKTIGMQTVRTDQIQVRLQSKLTAEQKTHAEALWNRIGREMRPAVDIQTWVYDFQCDLDPEPELIVWDKIADVVERLWNDRKFSRKIKRESLIDAVVSVSMQSVDIPAQVSGITDEHVDRIREEFSRTR